jgi:hypothetical protein
MHALQGCNATAADAQPLPPTDAVLGMLAQEQTRTRHLIEALATKLTVARADCGGAPSKKDPAPSPTFATPLLRAIDERVDNQRGINGLLSDLLDSVVL